MNGSADTALLNTDNVSLQAKTFKEEVTVLLLKAGADPNIVYPESSHDDKRNGLKIVNLKLGNTSSKKKGKKRTSHQTESAPKQDYKCTIMINYAQHNKLKKDQLLETFRTLVKYGAKLDGADSNGLTVLDHAIMTNNTDLVAWILANLNGLDTDHR